MTKTELILLYLCGFSISFYAGMRFEALRWGKRIENDIQKAYTRGFKAGLEHIDRISIQKTDMESSMRILTGEESEPYEG